MGFRRKYKRKGRARYRRKKRKWRQQKLAVGTVQKIARSIAKQEDKKNMHKYVHVTYVKPEALNWAAGYLAHLPPTSLWSQLGGGASFEFSNISTIGGHIQDANMAVLDAAEQGQVQLRIHGCETFGIIKNNSVHPVRVEVRLVYIPNTNIYTDDLNDYLTPRSSMFFKSGKGNGVLLRQGYDRKSLAAFSATGIPVKYQTLARKVMFLPSATVTGTLTTPADPLHDPPLDQLVQTIVQQTPTVYKRFSLKKYFKHPRRAYARANNDPLTNGNYFLVYWTDAPLVTDTVSLLMTSNIQYSLKSVMKDDTS